MYKLYSKTFFVNNLFGKHKIVGSENPQKSSFTFFLMMKAVMISVKNVHTLIWQKI